MTVVARLKGVSALALAICGFVVIRIPSFSIAAGQLDFVGRRVWQGENRGRGQGNVNKMSSSGMHNSFP